MKSSTLVLLACPQCLKDLSWRTLASGAEELVCHSCQRIFPIVDGVPFFAMRATDAPLELQEMDAEVKWIISENDLQEHLTFASSSAQVGRQLMFKLVEQLPFERHNSLQALDLGSGACLQSWQLAQLGFSVTAIELVPEFLFSAPPLPETVERVCSDISILPLKSKSFDVVFCKESLHHVSDLEATLREIIRVCKTGGWIVIEEPTWPRDAKSHKMDFIEHDHAAQMGITHALHNYAEYSPLINAHCAIRYRKLSPAKDTIERQLEWFAGYSRHTPSWLKPLFASCRSYYVAVRNHFAAEQQVTSRGGGFELVAQVTSPLPESSFVENRETIPIDSERIKKHQKAVKQMRDYNLAILKVFERDWASHADRFRRT
jgi:2-polyprenyl-3-methyl-5-hydroxy-6-metoxy-1,4-benzoquinol methylase/uncharacterized protein YbaR (Trm112 family)